MPIASETRARAPFPPRVVAALARRAHRALRTAWLGACALAPLGLGAAPAEQWAFSEPAGRPLSQALNTAPSRTGIDARWDVAIPGVATTGTGALRIRDTGFGGQGRRTTFVNLPAEIATGRASLKIALAGWDLAPPPDGPPPRLELGFTQGAETLVATLRLERAAEGLALGWHIGSATESTPPSAPGPPVAFLPAVSGNSLHLRLDLDLDARLLALVRTGREQPGQPTPPDTFIALAGLPPGLTRLTSLRLALRGDFTGGPAAGSRIHFMDIEELRLETDSALPFPDLAPGPDGLPGLLRLALGLPLAGPSPTGPEAALALPRVVPQPDGSRAFHFFRARSDLVYVIEHSRDLLVWAELTREPGAPGTPIAWPLPPATAEHPGSFARLRIELPE